MSSTIKIAIALVIILAVIVVGWIWFNNSSSQPISLPVSDVTSNTQGYAEATPIRAVENSPATTPVVQVDTSTAGLQSDVDGLNSQLNGLNTDSANIDQGLNVSTK
jgi:hypothetical protein